MTTEIAYSTIAVRPRDVSEAHGLSMPAPTGIRPSVVKENPRQRMGARDGDPSCRRLAGGSYRDVRPTRR